MQWVYTSYTYFQRLDNRILFVQNVSHWNPVEFVQLIYVGRMRTNDCRNKVLIMYPGINYLVG